MGGNNQEEDDGRMVFYYSREERLKRASPAVRKFNEPVVYKKPTLFRTLTATRPLALLFFTIVLLCVAIPVINNLFGYGNSKTLDGNTIDFSIISYSDTSFVTVVKKAKTGDAYAGAVNIGIALLEEDTPAYVEQIYFTGDKEEVFRFSVPFSGRKMFVVIEAGSARAALTIMPKQQ
jgi:hypothetical protein